MNSPFVWIPLAGYVDPPDAPDGYVTEVLRCPHMGIVTHYRHLPCATGQTE